MPLSSNFLMRERRQAWTGGAGGEASGEKGGGKIRQVRRDLCRLGGGRVEGARRSEKGWYLETKMSSANRLVEGRLGGGHRW